MARFNTAPNIDQFAKAWTRGFAKAVREAGGRDGRLSLNEAKSIARRDDPLAVYGDNAVNYLERTGQKSVSIDKLIGKGHDYVLATAGKVAGSNRRLSLVEARNLPEDLRADFAQLRGKSEAHVQPPLAGPELELRLWNAALVAAEQGFYDGVDRVDTNEVASSARASVAAAAEAIESRSFSGTDYSASVEGIYAVHADEEGGPLAGYVVVGYGSGEPDYNDRIVHGFDMGGNQVLFDEESW
jgi:hypothetical protein